MGVILGLLAAILWGFGDLLARFAGQAIGAWRTLFYSELAGVLFLTAWLALSTDGGGPPVPDLTVWAWAVGLVAAALHLIGAYALTHALTIGTISLVMPIASSYGAVSAALSILAGEPVTPTAMVGITITIVGVALAGQAHSEKAKRTTAGVGWALVAAAGFGVAFWVQGAILVPTIGSLPSVWLFLAFGVVVMGAAGLIGFGSLAFPPREAIPVTLGSGSLAVAAYIAVALGFATGQIAIVAVLSTLSSVITAILGYFVLGERLADRQIVGVVLIIVGVVIINVA
jgi:drug/metabolite transporter (DMT)-like permease